MTQLILAMAVFVGVHVFISGTGLRTVIVRMVGEKAFMGLFSVLALGSLVWVALAYRVAPFVQVWEPPTGLRWITLILVALAVWFIVASLMARNPTPSSPDDALKAPDAALGVVAITRHPFMWGIILWAIGHLLARGDQAAMVLFVGLGLLAHLGCLSQDRKMREKHGADWDAFAAKTSYFPGAAILAGRATLRASDIGWRSPLVALVVFVGLIAAHPWMFSVSPLPG